MEKSTKSTEHSLKQNEEQFLTFRIGDEWFGLLPTAIKDVMYTPQLASVPLASREVAGLINMRGHIVTAIHTSLLLGISARKDIAKNMCIVLQDQDDELYSFIVDKVFDIESFPKALFESLPLNLARQFDGFSDGVFRLEDRIVIILNKSKILSKLF